MDLDQKSTASNLTSTSTATSSAGAATVGGRQSPDRPPQFPPGSSSLSAVAARSLGHGKTLSDDGGVRRSISRQSTETAVLTSGEYLAVVCVSSYLVALSLSIYPPLCLYLLSLCLRASDISVCAVCDISPLILLIHHIESPLSPPPPQPR